MKAVNTALVGKGMEMQTPKSKSDRMKQHDLHLKHIRDETKAHICNINFSKTQISLYHNWFSLFFLTVTKETINMTICAIVQENEIKTGGLYIDNISLKCLKYYVNLIHRLLKAPRTF